MLAGVLHTLRLPFGPTNRPAAGGKPNSTLKCGPMEQGGKGKRTGHARPLRKGRTGNCSIKVQKRWNLISFSNGIVDQSVRICQVVLLRENCYQSIQAILIQKFED